MANSILDWAVGYGVTTNILGTSANTTVDGVTVTVGATQYGSYNSTPTAEIQPSGSLNGNSGILYFGMDASVDDNSSYLETTITFSQPVYDLTFNVIDIDGNSPGQNWSDRLVIDSDAGYATNVAAGSLVTYDPATGTATSLGGNTNDSRSELTYSFADGVTSVTIRYSADDVAGTSDPDQQIFAIDDLSFDAGPRDWSVTGLGSVDEGDAATYTIDFNGVLSAGQQASVDLSLDALDTDASDYASFVAAVNAAIASRPDLTFDGTTLTYSAPSEAYTESYDATGASAASSIAGTGTALNLNDDQTVTQALSFSFEFYGTSYSSIYIDSNGYVTFGGAPTSDYSNDDIAAGTALGGNPAIAAFWDDLNPSAAGDVYVQSVGSPGSMQYIIEWSDVPYYNGGGSNGGTIQLVLSEGTNEIEVRYLDVDFQGNGHDDGNSATIGIQDGAGTASEYSQNSQSVVAGSSLTYAPISSTFDPLTISLATVDDNSYEGDEDFSIVLSNPSASAVGTASQTTTIVDNEFPPVANDDVFSVSEDGSAAGNVLTDGTPDSDPDGDPLTVSEVNGNAANVGSQIALASGSLLTVQSDGSYVYDPNGAFESLPAGQNGADSFTYSISDGTGGTDTATVNVTINGANDAAVVGGTDTGSVTEDATSPDLTATGSMTVTDADTGESSFAAGTYNGTYGDLVLDAAGNWTYTASNSQTAIQALGAGESINDTISVQTADGTTHDVVIAINGANDAPTDFSFSLLTDLYLCLDDNGLVTAMQVTNGSVVASLGDVVDTDVNDTHSFTLVDGAGNPVLDPDFEIVGDQLIVRSTNTLVEGVDTSKTVIVRADDGNGGYVDKTLTVDVALYNGTYAGSAANDFAAGTSAAETIDGGAGDDYLVGAGGNDTLNGGEGNDFLDGGAGADVLNGGNGSDTASYFSAASGVTVDLVNNAMNTGDAAGDIILQVESVAGSAYDDDLRGDNGTNGIAGYDGDDIINGRGGNDYLRGGLGNDTFVFADGDGDDRIYDFEVGAGSDDVLDLTDYDFADFSAVQAIATISNGYVLLQLDADDSVWLYGVTDVNQLHSDDVIL